MVNVSASSSRSARLLRVGPLLMVLGAALVVAGLIQTTSSTTGGCDQGCPAGTTLVAKFNYNGTYVFEKPAGNEHVVTLSNSSSTGATWHSTIPLTALIVKGGPSSVLVTFTSPQRDGTFSNAVLPKVGNDKNRPAISNVQFCGPFPPVTTTTTQPPVTTTTTQPPVTTTTTRPPVTTTTTATTASPPPRPNLRSRPPRRSLRSPRRPSRQ